MATCGRRFTAGAMRNGTLGKECESQIAIDPLRSTADLLLLLLLPFVLLWRLLPLLETRFAGVSDRLGFTAPVSLGFHPLVELAG